MPIHRITVSKDGTPVTGKLATPSGDSYISDMVRLLVGQIQLICASLLSLVRVYVRGRLEVPKSVNRTNTPPRT